MREERSIAVRPVLARRLFKKFFLLNLIREAVDPPPPPSRCSSKLSQGGLTAVDPIAVARFTSPNEYKMLQPSLSQSFSSLHLYLCRECRSDSHDPAAACCSTCCQEQFSPQKTLVNAQPVVRNSFPQKKTLVKAQPVVRNSFPLKKHC